MSTWKTIVSTVAPLLGKAVAGPIGGTAMQYISDALLGKPDATEAEVEDAVKKATVEDLLKLKEADEKFKTDMRSLDLDELKLAYGDVASARSREQEVVKSTGKKDTNLYAMAWTTIVGFLIVLLVMILFGSTLPATGMAATALPILLGALIACFKDVYGYFFGSSKSSSDKNEMINASKLDQEELKKLLLQVRGGSDA